MAEYIEREKVEEMLNQLYCGHGEYWCNALDAAETELVDIPTADVRPERHGEWVHLGGDEWGCSCCGFVISTESSREHPISETQCNDYCRKCGAKMDGKETI